jgi:hypothetical protein
LVVEEVVRHVVASVAKNATAVRSRGRIPVPEDDGVREFPEGCGKHDEQRGWHDKPVLIHGEVMVDAVEEKMQGDTNAVVW